MPMIKDYKWSAMDSMRLIQLYRIHENLYNTTLPTYVNKVIRQQTIDKMAGVLQIPAENVKFRLRTLRSQFLKELRYMAFTKRYAIHGDKTYRPKLWCFNDLKFLMPYCRTAYSVAIDEIEIESSHDSNASNVQTHDIEVHYIEMDNVEGTHDEPDSVMNVPLETETNGKKKRKRDPTDEVLLLAAERLRQEPDITKKIADNWACKLRQMTDMQKLYAEKFINDVLFEGLLGNLTRHSVIINTNPPSSPIATQIDMPDNVPDVTYTNPTEDPLDTKEFILSERVPPVDGEMHNYMYNSPAIGNMQEQQHIEENETKYEI